MRTVTQLISIISFSCLLSALFFLVTAPIIAVFIIDDAVSSTDFLRMLLWVGGMALLFTTVLLMPASLILDHAFKKSTMVRFWAGLIIINILATLIYIYSVFVSLPTSFDIIHAMFNPVISVLSMILITSYWLFYRSVLFFLRSIAKLKTA